jgi:formate hydrogenlyase subunit 4
LLPWLPIKPILVNCDIFVILYLLAAIRFWTIIAALDPGSPFGAFSSGREATLSVLTEPAIILCLLAPAFAAHSTDLNRIFFASSIDAPIWLLAGAGLFLASLVELSRMPLDDPSTHLELTMVHEAMVFESSGRYFALVEFAYAMRLLFLYGLTAQCAVQVLCLFLNIGLILNALITVLIVFALAILTGIVESFCVKLAWRKNADFIAYALTMGLLAVLAALTGGSPK